MTRGKVAEIWALRGSNKVWKHCLSQLCRLTLIRSLSLFSNGAHNKSGCIYPMANISSWGDVHQRAFDRWSADKQPLCIQLLPFPNSQRGVHKPRSQPNCKSENDQNANQRPDSSLWLEIIASRTKLVEKRKTLKLLQILVGRSGK